MHLSKRKTFVAVSMAALLAAGVAVAATAALGSQPATEQAGATAAAKKR